MNYYNYVLSLANGEKRYFNTDIASLSEVVKTIHLNLYIVIANSAIMVKKIVSIERLSDSKENNELCKNILMAIHWSHKE